MAPTAARARRPARATPTITEPAFPAWAAVAAILTLGAFIAVLPGGPASAAAAAPPPSPPSWSATLHAVRPLVAADLAAAACIFAFLKAGEAYGRARQVGWALRRLPLPSTVPWQRVVNAQGRISMDPSRQGSDWIQRELLLGEGLAVAADGRLPLAAHRWQPADPAPGPAPGALAVDQEPTPPL